MVPKSARLHAKRLTCATRRQQWCGLCMRRLPGVHSQVPQATKRPRQIGENMGANIYAFVEQRFGERWDTVDMSDLLGGDRHSPAAVWKEKNYKLFGWLGNQLRNDAAVPSLCESRGLPEDVSDEVANEADFDAWMASWLRLDELLDFNYDATFEDRSTTGDSPYGRTYPAGMGRVTTYREAFGPEFFNDLKAMSTLGEPANIRVVFFFDAS